MKLSELKAKIAEFEKACIVDLDYAEVWSFDDRDPSDDGDYLGCNVVTFVTFDPGTDIDGIRYADTVPSFNIHFNSDAETPPPDLPPVKED